MTAILGVVLGHRLGLKRVKVEADRVTVEAQEVVARDEADIRDHYADEVRQLRGRLDEQSERSKAALRSAEERHEICRRERDELRDDARSLKDIVAGLIRIITQASASQAIRLGPDASAEVAAAARRVQMLFASPNAIEKDSES